jgi:aryl-alcohol dehydrogenase-like predicted oxidoreductase
MRYRPLGQTGLTVSEIGFGAWGIGGPSPGATSYGPTDDAVSLGTLARAFEQGITLYDTSNAYGKPSSSGARRS